MGNSGGTVPSDDEKEDYRQNQNDGNVPFFRGTEEIHNAAINLHNYHFPC